MFQEQLLESWKKWLARGGDAKVFGEDSDFRKHMSDEKALRRFSKVWKETLEPAIQRAEHIPLEKVISSVDDKQKKYALKPFQYRQFSIDSAVFIVRLNEGAKASGVCSQLWPLGAHRDNTRLCIHFNTVAEKEFFDSLAKNLGWTKPAKLALQLVTDFMSKFPDYDSVDKTPHAIDERDEDHEDDE